MRKIFTDFPITDEFTLQGIDAKHVLRVLRYDVGDTVMVTDCTGNTYACEIVESDGVVARLQPLKHISSKKPSSGVVVLAVGLLKNDKFDWVIQKGTELGVDVIVPIQMEHCVVKLNDNRQSNKLNRWRRIAIEAAKQCGRDDIPIVDEIATWDKLCIDYKDYHFLVPYERETRPLRDVIPAFRQGNIVVCIGPEGGFSLSEIDVVKSMVGATYSVSLGTRILRAETAALATLAIIMYERGL